MKIGVPTETKPQEGRVALTPAGTKELVARGHEVIVQSGCGERSRISDEAYRAQGARVAQEAHEIFGAAELIVKVKEPQPFEVDLLREEQILFTYLHLAANPALARSLCQTGATCIAYETVEHPTGRLPLLAPMSEIAGRIGAQMGAGALASPFGGRGVLIGGVPGVAPARVAVIGGGVAGSNAARVALGMGAEVVVLDRSLERLRDLDHVLDGRVTTQYASSLAIEQVIATVDLVIGAVLIHGARSPRLVRREQLVTMKEGSVVVDISIDQGGCFETSRPTSHDAPTYTVDGVVHYCVTNMPGAVPVSSTYALTNATFPYVSAIAEFGLDRAMTEAGLGGGVNVRGGRLLHPVVAAEVLAAEPEHETAVR